jgi:hypothetical protein
MRVHVADFRPLGMNDNLLVAIQRLQEGKVDDARRYGARAEFALSPATGGFGREPNWRAYTARTARRWRRVRSRLSYRNSLPLRTPTIRFNESFPAARIRTLFAPLCNRQCNDRVRTGRSGRNRTEFGQKALSAVTCEIERGNRESRETADEAFKTTAIDHSAIPPCRTLRLNFARLA